MRVVGEICLLTSLVCTGYAAFVCVWGGLGERRRALATTAALAGFASLSVTLVILAWALVARDFRFEYVAQYSSRLLPWHYRLSALWVGQAGSLLLWAWLLAVLAIALRWLSSAEFRLKDTAFGLLMGNVCFLETVLVFAADPMKASLVTPEEGHGLSPLLQHPSMLIHPPVVFFAYAAWAVPCALAVAALVRGRLDATWTQVARPWALLAWTVLGVGLLLGANWAYQELGWGGYWGWDPVENGSLLPWLTGTALVHSMMAWRSRNCLKKTAIALAVVTFALCNFATFLTRSGIFSSVHAFSESPIGWMFLALMAVMLAGGATLMVLRRNALVAERSLGSLAARETIVLVSTFLLSLFALVVLVGTLVDPVSKHLLGRTVQVGPPFYNNVLMPIGLALLAATAVVPLLQWGAAPSPARRRALVASAGVGLVATLVALLSGISHPTLLAVVALAAVAVGSLGGAWLLDARRRISDRPWRGLLRALSEGRRPYAAYMIHLGLVCVAIGVAGSSLGTRRHQVVLDKGDEIRWSGRNVRYVELVQRTLPDKLIAEAVLDVSRDGSEPVRLRPARYLYLLQNQWTTEVDIDSTWRGDFYTVLNAGLGDDRISLTLVDNPLIRWMWVGGLWITVSAIVAIWPASRRRRAATLPADDRVEDAANQPERRVA